MLTFLGATRNPYEKSFKSLTINASKVIKLVFWITMFYLLFEPTNISFYSQ